VSPPAAVARRAEHRAPDTESRPSHLAVVRHGRRETSRRRRRRTAESISAVLVLGSLLAVVVGHAALAQGQLRLSGAQASLSTEQTRHRQEMLSVAQLETPARIAAEAQQQFHMVRPAKVNQLPTVPLSVALPAPHVTAAPPASIGASSAGSSSAGRGTQGPSTTTSAPTATTATASGR
jgi:hypothetical protein